MPTSAQSESKAIFCYVQALHAAFEALVSMNETAANKYISAIVSLLQEFITKGGRIEKQSVGILKSIMSSCIRKSLWITTPGHQDDFLNFDNIGLDEEKASNFAKVVYMLERMLSDEFRNQKFVASILEAFFGSLDESALEGTAQLIDKVVNFRNQWDEKSFRNVMQAIYGAMGIKNLCHMYPISVAGDIASPSFESDNNLWMLYCVEKYEGSEEVFETFSNHFYPLLIALRNILSNPNLTGARKDGYRALK